MLALKYVSDEEILGMSPRRITLSTSGIAPKIVQLADDGAQFNLAISLHTANDKKRDHLMPINKKYPLEELSKAIEYYHNKTENRLTFEYLMLRNFNDSLEDAKELARFCKVVPCKINLIEYNKVEGTEFEKSSADKLRAFADFLESKNMIINIRHSKGEDIDAACGQLANKLKNTPLPVVE